MKSLWAPWRMKYLKQNQDFADGCLFCDNLQEDLSLDNLVVYKSENAGVMLNKFPYNNGHVLVIPYMHTSSLEDLPNHVVMELVVLNKLVIRCLRTLYNPEGFNVGMNIGKAAGAGIPDHLHMHILPRWSHDTNFVTTIAELRVIPEEMKNTYYHLQQMMENNDLIR